MTFLLVDRMSLERASASELSICGSGSELNEMQRKTNNTKETEQEPQHQQIEIESVIDINAHWPLYPWLNRFAICHTIRTQLHRSKTLSQATLASPHRCRPPLTSPFPIWFDCIQLLCFLFVPKMLRSVNLYWITVRSKVLCDTEYENQIAKTTTTSTKYGMEKKINK